MTNFDFDTDQDFSNNKDNWEKLNSFIDGSDYSDWAIRPTMYTAMLEYMSEDEMSKGATLLYHIYHAKQDRSIHDWERVEIRLKDITGSPGSGEVVVYVVVTEHSEHKIRYNGHGDLNFMTTSDGSHPMVWQAEQRKERNLFGDLTGFYGGEVHFVEDSFETIDKRVQSDDTGEVEVNGDGEKKNVHYIFVPQDDDDAVSYWNAQTLTQSNAFGLQSGMGTGGIPFSEVKRIKYELQDLADIFPTHWDGGFFNRHWSTKSSRRVYLEEPLAGGIDGGPPVPIGLQTFYVTSLDDEDKDEDRAGYPTKTWFWGYYDEYSTSEALSDPDRIAANGDPDSAVDRYFRQHDFYVHDEPSGVERWLPHGWHLSENGGFDGRWAQLF